MLYSQIIGDIMNFLKIFLLVAVICCLVCSVGAISAEEVAADQGGSSDTLQAQDTSSSDNSNGAVGDADTNGNGNGDSGSTVPTDPEPVISNDNTTGNATPEITNSTPANKTGNTTGNATNHTAGNNTLGNALHNLLATGNPIFIVLILIVVAGGITIFRRNK